MPVATTWPSEESIPEEFQPLKAAGFITAKQTPEGERWSLDSAETFELRSRLKEFRNTNTTLMTQAEEGAKAAQEAEQLRQRLAEIEAEKEMGGDVDRVKDLLDAQMDMVEFGGVSFQVPKVQKPRVMSALSGIANAQKEAESKFQTVDKVFQERQIRAKVAEAKASVPGIHPAGVDDDIEAFARGIVRFNASYEPEIHVGGAIRYGADEKPLTFAAALRERCELPPDKGGKAGIWTKPPASTPSWNGGGAGTPGDVSDTAAALRRMQKG